MARQMHECLAARRPECVSPSAAGALGQVMNAAARGTRPMNEVLHNPVEAIIDLCRWCHSGGVQAPSSSQPAGAALPASSPALHQRRRTRAGGRTSIQALTPWSCAACRLPFACRTVHGPRAARRRARRVPMHSPHQHSRRAALRGSNSRHQRCQGSCASVAAEPAGPRRSCHVPPPTCGYLPCAETRSIPFSAILAKIIQDPAAKQNIALARRLATAAMAPLQPLDGSIRALKVEMA